VEAMNLRDVTDAIRMLADADVPCRVTVVTEPSRWKQIQANTHQLAKRRGIFVSVRSRGKGFMEITRYA